MEVDEETLANMKQMQFPTDCANEELAEAYRGLEKAIADLNNEDLEDVAADYAKTFLAAGEATGVAAFPYESIYTNKKREIGGRTEQETLALYALHGWEPSKDMFRTMNRIISAWSWSLWQFCVRKSYCPVRRIMQIVRQCLPVTRMSFYANI